MMRIGSTSDRAAYKFDVDQAVRAYYSLAPFHKEFTPQEVKTVREEPKYTVPRPLETEEVEDFKPPTPKMVPQPK
jgi:hypothetical protein